MSTQHPLTEDWERRLVEVFHRLDAFLESRWGDRFPRRPQRPADGETANPQYSGLFNVGASFTAGFGSHYGRGYVVDVEICTYEPVAPEVRQAILHDAIQELGRLLREAFPERHLEVVQDGPVYKIVGDLQLGEA